MELELPEEIPVMALPNTVLFPQMVLPLYIFENRYRRMLSDVLAGGRIFAVANRKSAANEKTDDPETFHDIATAGLVRMSELNPDGTSTLMLMGAARVHIDEVLQSAPYPVARVSIVNSKEINHSSQAANLRTELLDALETFGSLSPKENNEVIKACQEILNLEALIHFAMQTCCSNGALNQEILECVEISLRAEMAIGYFQARISDLKLKRDLDEGSEEGQSFEN